MLEHLITGDFEPVVRENASEGFVRIERAGVSDVVDAQQTTTTWMQELGLTEAQVLPDIEKEQARNAFAALTVVTDADKNEIKERLLELKIPQQVQHLVGMLTLYDWEWVTRAKELRSFVVTRLVEEASQGKQGDRIKALALLGKVTEVGLFTEQIEVKKDQLTDEDLDAKIKEKLLRITGQSGDVTEVLPRGKKNV